MQKSLGVLDCVVRYFDSAGTFCNELFYKSQMFETLDRR